MMPSEKWYALLAAVGLGYTQKHKRNRRNHCSKGVPNSFCRKKWRWNFKKCAEHMKIMKDYERLKLFAAQVPQVQQCCGEMWMGKMCIWSPWRPKSWRPSTCGCLGAEQLMQSCPEADICSLGAALVAVRVKAGFYSKLQEPGVFPRVKVQSSESFKPSFHPMSTQCGPIWDQFSLRLWGFQRLCRFAVTGSMWCWAPSLDISLLFRGTESCIALSWSWFSCAVLGKLHRVIWRFNLIQLHGSPQCNLLFLVRRIPSGKLT